MYGSDHITTLFGISQHFIANKVLMYIHTVCDMNIYILLKD